MASLQAWAEKMTGSGRTSGEPGRSWRYRFPVRVDPEDLLAAVLADPADDALRQVYADRLIELGDGILDSIHLAPASPCW